MSVHPLFQGEDHFTNRKITPANNSHEPQFVPEAPMIIDALPEDFGPHVNTPPSVPYDETLMPFTTAQIALMCAATGAVALIMAGFDWLMGVM